MQLPKKKKECPLNGKCLTTAIVYQATVQYDGKTAKYIGLTEGDFKTSYTNHVKSFKHIKYKAETELSKPVWSLKEKKQTVQNKVENSYKGYTLSMREQTMWFMYH